MLAYCILITPLAAGLVAGVVPWSRLIGWLATVANGAVLGFGIALCSITLHGRVVSALDGAVRADALSAFMVVVIGSISVLASWQSVRYLADELRLDPSARRRATRYSVLIQVFVTCMLAAVLAANLGALWVAIEATTIATSFLIGHHRGERSLEASWKYVVICSVGIALALFGTVLMYFAALHPSGSAAHGAISLDWTSLLAEAPRLDPGVVRLALALVVLGYGTKVGLAPMHSWLPDAHSEAPAPVSALMSGVLLAVAFYALLRFKAIADASLGVGYARMLFVVFGLASLVVASSLLITQHDYKRMLAYSSIEHMGLIALGAAAGSALAIAAVLLHIVGHGLAKSVLFLASGEILLVDGSTEIGDVHALLARRPVLGGIFGFGLLALLGLPPFSLFVSELTMVRAEFSVGLGWVAAISLACMAVIFAAIANHGRNLLLGSIDHEEMGQRTSSLVSVPLIGGLAACAVFGIASWPLQSILHAAASTVVR
jgi:hydrogenase-4 component F